MPQSQHVLHVQVYSIAGSTLCLTGTAEVPLGAYYMDQILSEEQLPIKMAAYGHCFRTEAGAAGPALCCFSIHAVHLTLDRLLRSSMHDVCKGGVTDLLRRLEALTPSHCCFPAWNYLFLDKYPEVC